MKKLLFFIITFCILFFMTSCDDDIGLGYDGVPENLFAGGAWEQIINENMPWFKVHRKLSFAVNTFTLYEERQDSTKIYTGTYRLFYEGEYKLEKIEFNSDEPTLNGAIGYSFLPIHDAYGEQLYPDNSVTFSKGALIDFPISDFYTPINN